MGNNRLVWDMRTFSLRFFQSVCQSVCHHEGNSYPVPKMLKAKFGGTFFLLVSLSLPFFPLVVLASVNDFQTVIIVVTSGSSATTTPLQLEGWTRKKITMLVRQPNLQPLVLIHTLSIRGGERGRIQNPVPRCVALANQRLRPLHHCGSPAMTVNLLYFCLGYTFKNVLNCWHIWVNTLLGNISI